jgi:hypothetical protein
VLGDVCVITNQALTYEDLYAKAQPQSAPAAA